MKMRAWRTASGRYRDRGTLPMNPLLSLSSLEGSAHEWQTVIAKIHVVAIKVDCW